MKLLSKNLLLILTCLALSGCLSAVTTPAKVAVATGEAAVTVATAAV